MEKNSKGAAVAAEPEGVMLNGDGIEVLWIADRRVAARLKGVFRREWFIIAKSIFALLWLNCASGQI